MSSPRRAPSSFNPQALRYKELEPNLRTCAESFRAYAVKTPEFDFLAV